ncbi:50S ribosomal protein L9 [Kiritimatiella glycovorans]|uniref:Large ribosomal subunit protein bL9 n=1 Tax=Kiritimatiella glycovorans TaxID=1307763 RepID=A0A0G3ED99_9BACT|nr:50S ribosomal protein L9 [Kiritimatiella glycovorans]AKJ64431.1 50S ribosomal protein L9 [Kiritimatiella glycovorans]
MAKEVILLERVENLGIEGDVVRVADGYARNYLVPRGLAAPVTEGRRRQIENKRRERLRQMREELEAARELAEKIDGMDCTVLVKTGDQGQLFGSVNAQLIADKVREEKGIELDRKQIVLEDPIRELGVFDVAVDLHPEVQPKLKVWVVEE